MKPRDRLQVYPRLQLDISFFDLITSLLSFGKVADTKQSFNCIQSFWNVDKEIIVTLSVRTAFDLLLQSLNLPVGSEVLISAINIRHMAEIVQLHGLVPVPVDISIDTCEPSLELLEKLVSPQTKILLVAHLFGGIFNLQPYGEFCRRYNLILIEDCAQAFTGNKYYGHPQADVSFFSFGAIKSSTALGGAVTLVGDKILAEKILALQQHYPQKSEFWFFLRLIKYLGLKTLSIPWIYCQLLYILKIFGKDLEATINSTTRGFSQGNLLSKIRYRPPQLLIWLLARRLSQCEGFVARVETAQKFINLLNKTIIVPGVKAEYNSFWLMPILAEKPELLLLELQKNNFDATRGNTSLIAIEPSSQGNYPFPENAKYLMEHILYLPVYKDVPDSQLQRLAESVNEF